MPDNSTSNQEASFASNVTGTFGIEIWKATPSYMSPHNELQLPDRHGAVRAVLADVNSAFQLK